MKSDLLSFSASLLDIISFVHPKDIPNCRLVSRRLNGVITRNSKMLRKLSATMRFYTCYTRGGTFCYFYVYVNVDNERNEVLRIYENYTVISQWYHKRCITEYYKENGIEPNEGLLPILFDEIRPSFVTPSFDRGLRLALRYFFKRYQFSSIQFYSNCDVDGLLEPLDWCPVVFEEFHQCRTVCSQVHLFIWHEPILHSFYTFVSTSVLSIMIKRDFGQVLNVIPRWDRKLHIIVSREVFKDFGTIVDFVKNWESGKISKIKYVFLEQKEEKDARKFNLNSAKVVRMLSCCQCLSVKKLIKEGDQGFYVEIAIRRSIDDRILVVQYDKQQRYLIIQEAAPLPPPPPQYKNE